jgi:hypothetical protein
MTGSRSLIGLLVLCVALASTLLGPSPAHSSIIFDSLPPTAGAGGCSPSCEAGNLVGFAGADRDLTDLSIRYQAGFALAGRTAVVRLYALDGGGAPGSKLFESAAIAAPGSSGQIDIHGIGIHVPDSLLWTVAFTAPPPEPLVLLPDEFCICLRADVLDLVGPAAGLLQSGSADGSGWYRFFNQDTWTPLYPTLFAARFDAEGSVDPSVTTPAPLDPPAVPFPGTLVLLTAATVVVAWRRRKGSANV